MEDYRVAAAAFPAAAHGPGDADIVMDNVPCIRPEPGDNPEVMRCTEGLLNIIDSAMKQTHKLIENQDTSLEKIGSALQRVENMFFSQAKALEAIYTVIQDIQVQVTDLKTRDKEEKEHKATKDLPELSQEEEDQVEEFMKDSRNADASYLQEEEMLNVEKFTYNVVVGAIQNKAYQLLKDAETGKWVQFNHVNGWVPWRSLFEQVSTKVCANQLGITADQMEQTFFKVLLHYTSRGQGNPESSTYLFMVKQYQYQGQQHKFLLIKRRVPPGGWDNWNQTNSWGKRGRWN